MPVLQNRGHRLAQAGPSLMNRPGGAGDEYRRSIPSSPAPRCAYTEQGLFDRCRRESPTGTPVRKQRFFSY